MKRFSGLLLLLLCTQSLQAADLALQMELPDVEMLMPPVSSPLLQQEGMPLFQERELVETLLAHIGQNTYEEALVFLQERLGDSMGLLLNGDPDRTLVTRVVPGGMMPSTRNNQISATMMYLIGHTLFSLEEYEAAERAFLSALAPIPDYTRVHESLGLLYMQIERFEEAQQHLSHAAELGLHTASLFGALGYLNHRNGNYWGAANAFQEALMLSPGNPSWKRGLLFALGQSNQFHAGLSLVESMLVETPNDSELWVYRSRYALQANDQASALTSLETAIRLGEDSVANLQVCATLHMQIGSINRAVQLLQAGMFQGIDFQFIDQAMTWLRQAGEWDFLEELTITAREDWNELSDLQKSRLLLHEAEVSHERNAVTGARDALRQAIEFDPGNAQALILLANIERDTGNFNRAELLYQRASSYEQYRENALVSLAQLALDQDNFDRGLQILRQVLSENPQRSDISRNIETLENIVLLQSDN